MAKKAAKYKKKNGFAQRILHSLEISPEVLSSVIAVTLWGNSYAKIENHLGILELKSDLIRLRSPEGAVKINGENLVLEQLEGNIVRIKGIIKNIEYIV